MEQKYLVVKFEDANLLGKDALGDAFLDSETYFVVRESDVFGAAALYGYAHVIQTGLELHAMLLDEGRPALFSEEQAETLRVLADEVSELAERWQRMTVKVPD